MAAGHLLTRLLPSGTKYIMTHGLGGFPSGVTIIGDIAVNIPIQTIAGIATVTNYGAVTITLPIQTVSGIGTITNSGTIAITIPIQAVSGIGTITNSGTAAITIPSLLVSMAGQDILTGAVTVNLPIQVVAGVGTRGIVGTIAVNIPIISISAAGTFTVLQHMRESIFTALVLCLKRITTAGGYNYAIRNVYDPPVAINKMNEFPSINIHEGSETCVDGSIIYGNGALLPNYFDVQFDCILNDVNNPRQARGKILQDIQNYFGNNHTIPDASGNATASQCFYKGAIPFGIQATRPLVGIAVFYRIWYRQKINDPTSN